MCQSINVLPEMVKHISVGASIQESVNCSICVGEENERDISKQIKRKAGKQLSRNIR